MKRKWTAHVLVYLKPSILNVEGKAVQTALCQQLHHPEVAGVRVGKYLIVNFGTEMTWGQASSLVKLMCEELLVNEVIETFDFTLSQTEALVSGSYVVESAQPRETSQQVLARLGKDNRGRRTLGQPGTGFADCPTL
jgi:phosphoribosylformylglycinamidine synthase PurS subunit